MACSEWGAASSERKKIEEERQTPWKMSTIARTKARKICWSERKIPKLYTDLLCVGTMLAGYGAVGGAIAFVPGPMEYYFNLISVIAGAISSPFLLCGMVMEACDEGIRTIEPLGTVLTAHAALWVLTSNIIPMLSVLNDLAVYTAAMGGILILEALNQDMVTEDTFGRLIRYIRNKCNRPCKLDPANATFHSNKAAAYFEEAKYAECIESCQKAIDVGREHRADYTVIAKAMVRAGNAEAKRGDPKAALTWFLRSLSVHRDPELAEKATQLENDIKENEQISEVEKKEANRLFKKGDIPGAMEHYNEAVKRNPYNAILYSNRAACLTKLADFQRALEDCEKSLKLDPKFIKAYIRKGAVLIAMKEWSKAKATYESALQLDSANAEALEGRALADPEVQEILRDPSMRLILEQMQSDPAAQREHQNPEITKKIMKLRDAGILQIR